ncbi:hypothetical protein ILUMI_21635 [Ignelater luminosus]|uniref:DNA/RNA non-specific endonuclease/pyrophosphatase/phosphodiesterase domain-containing protein n=1 Tax=Ignelater luminosus TaxID=2038154 RepID=A0A8K0CIE0_IGNLU|nr:hypothetical protein ILUMI_21635 [Ignelater luminosus]
MNHYFVICIFLALQALSFGAVIPKAGCEISVNEHLTEPQPLLLLQNEATHDLEAFPLPIDKYGTLTFAKGETIDLACPGGKVVLDKVNTDTDILEAKCVSETVFEVQKKKIPFTSITCSKIPAHTARYSGKKCATKYREIEIGFKINNRFITHILTCFDDVLQHVVYSKSNVSTSIAGNQINYPRPSFQVASFYNVKPDSVSTLYSQKGQRKTINTILGLDESNTSVIQPNSNFYLATGHYTPKAEFVYGSQQRLTFYYVNAAPQWQSFNGGNWNTMEANYRDLAFNRGLDFTVYTGTHGISTLPDINGNDQELYLWISDGTKKGIPVPALFYKVLYEPISQAGIALVGLNNPYKKDIKDDIICKDVCDKVNWLSWKNKNITLGYGYCCEVDDLRKTIKTLPNFTVKKLLV